MIVKEACPSCKEVGGDSAGDNLITFDNGSKHCFACDYHSNDNVTCNEDYTPTPSDLIQGEYRDLAGRGISKDTCYKYSYAVGRTKAGTRVHLAGYYNQNGELVAQKLRDAEKNFPWVGNRKEEAILFGQQLFTPNKNLFVTITEGEIDALSIAETQGAGYPVVSVSKGAAGAYEEIKRNLVWLQGFKHVVLAFDMDDAGVAAAKKCATLFEIGKVKIAKFPLKDANAMLLAGKGKDLVYALHSAEEFRPDGIVCLSDIIDKCLVPPKMGMSWPWPKLTELTYGIQKGSVYTFGAGSGVGKTTFISQLLLHLIRENKCRIGVFSFEDETKDMGQRLAGAMLNKRIHIPGVEFDKQKIKEVLTSIGQNVFLYDDFGVVDMDIVTSKIRYFVKGLDCDVIVVDPFTILTSGFKDERKDIDKAMATFRSLAKELRCVFLLVSHLAKPMDGTSYEEGKKVVPAAFRGSNTIQMFSSFMLGLERNKLSGNSHDKLVTTVRVLKDRFTGEADGCTVLLKYNQETGILDEIDEVDNFLEHEGYEPNDKLKRAAIALRGSIEDDYPI